MRLFSLFLAFLLLAGCNKPRTVKMSSVKVIDCNANYYTVLPNDSLSSIAGACGRSYLDLAKLNSLEDPYILYPNQKLRLYSDVPVKNDAEKEVQLVKKPTSAAQSKQLTAPLNAPRVQTIRQSKMDSQPLKKVETRDKSLPAMTGWQWPTTRTLKYKKIKEGTAQGFEVYGREGSPIYAVQSGQVVYVGDGIERYGHLVIVKHQNDLISVYAHNQKIFVTEGQNINAGQRLALMGDTGTTQTKLYFELRKKGKAISPYRYLGQP